MIIKIIGLKLQEVRQKQLYLNVEYFLLKYLFKRSVKNERIKLCQLVEVHV